MLLHYSADRPLATAQELAQAVSVPTSTAYRYISLLRELALLEEAPGGRYRLGPRVHALAAAAAQQNRLGRLARPTMERLTADLGETSMLVRVITNAAICVERVESPRPVRLSVQPGQPMPLYSGASGKLLLASLPAAERERLLSASTDLHATREPARFRAELEQIARRGWSESRAEIDDGIWACAVAVRITGEPQAALSIAGPAYRLDSTRRRRIRHELLLAAASIHERASDAE